MAVVLRWICLVHNHVVLDHMNTSNIKPFWLSHKAIKTLCALYIGYHYFQIQNDTFGPRCILAFIQPFNCPSSYLEFFFKQVNASDHGFRCNKRPKFYVSSVWKWNTWRIINKWNMTSKFLPPVPWVSTAGRPTNVDASKCHLLDISAPKLETNSKFIMFFRFTITKKKSDDS